MNLLIGLDLGTTTIKASAYDPDAGRVRCTATRPTPVTHPQAGWSEHDPAALWQAVTGCLAEVAAQTAGEAYAGLAIASFAEAGLPLDAAGRTLYPVIAWYDWRCEAQAALWRQRWTATQLHAITGQRASPSFGANKWLWLREHHPEIIGQTARWLSVPDYILWQLAGVTVTDYSIASRTLLFDQLARAWSPELLAATGLTAEQLPRAQPAGTAVGTLTPAAAAVTGLPAGMPCVLGGHDHLCASLAVGAWQPGTIVDSSGTAGAVLALLPAFHTSLEAAVGGFACYAHVLPDLYVLKAGLKLTGGAVDWLARQLAGPGTTDLHYEALEAAAAQGVGRRAGPVWLPHLHGGSGTPEGDLASLAALVGIRSDHEPGDLFRGLLESLAFWLRHNVEAMAALTRQAATDSILTGGTTRLHLLNQLKADVLDRPVVVSDVPEAAALGAALLAGLGAGVFRSPAEAAASVQYGRTVIEPQPEHAGWYDALYRDVYRRLYADLREVNHRLAELNARRE
jgi:xylulokinase